MLKKLFQRAANKVAFATGTPMAFLAAISIVVIWGLTGKAFNYSDTWQLVINTGTTIVTFLMVFLIQNTQNRDSKALHLKIDELIRSTSKARDEFVELDKLSDEELSTLETQLNELVDTKKFDKLTGKLQKIILHEKSQRILGSRLLNSAAERLKLKN